MEITYRTRSHFRLILLLLTMLAVVFVYSAETSWAAPKFTKQKVRGVAVSGVAGNTIVSWKKVKGSSGYVVYASRWKTKNYKPVSTVKPSVNKVKVTTLAGNKVYYFRVRAYKRTGKKITYSKLSDRFRYKVKPAPVAKKTVKPSKPAVPTVSVRALEPTVSKIRVSITAAKGASGYEVWRSTSSKGSYSKIKTLGAKTLAYDDTGLSSNKWYYYKVRAYAGSGKNTVYGNFSSVSADTTGGNSSQFNLSKVNKVNSSLKGRRILFLGSSITRGHSSGNISFVDYLAHKHSIDVVAKDAVNGTTISFASNNNYIQRLENYDALSGAELLVCQLSTNDSRYKLNNIRIEGKTLDPENDENHESPDEIGDEAILEELRDKAASEPYYVDDAIKYIIAYSNIRLGCPAVFFSCPRFKTTETFDSEFYSDMRECMLDTCETWAADNEFGRSFEVSVIDLWGEPSLAGFETYNEARSFYMMDSVHPTKAGYYRKYLPSFESHLMRLF